MKSQALLRRAVRAAIYANAAVVSAGLPALADAQTAPAKAEQPEAAAPVTEVVVTGSRITNPALQAISPVTTVSADVIKSQGTTRIEDLLNNLPQVVADQGSMSSNGASGTATVNLRGLGPQRTLVLINGRRLMPGTPSNTPSFAAPDLNNIPASLVERVDVLTGGASAVYGADATAGVVNFIMNDHFQGFRVDANAAMNNHSQHNYYGQFAPAAGYGSAPSSVNDGKTKDITFILGGNFADDKGNATVYLGYRRIDALLQSQRDFSRCTLATVAGNTQCSGSSTAANGRFFASNFLPPPTNSVPTGTPTVPMPTATTDSPRAMRMTSPWRSTKCAGASSKPPVPARRGVAHSSATASAHTTYSAVPPRAPASSTSNAEPRLNGAMRRIARTACSDEVRVKRPAWMATTTR